MTSDDATDMDTDVMEKFNVGELTLTHAIKLPEEDNYSENLDLISSSSSHLLYEMENNEDWEHFSCCSNYSGATNTTYSLNTNLLSTSDFPSSEDSHVMS